MHTPKPQSRTCTSVSSGKFYVNLTKLSHMRREISLGYTRACRAFLFVIQMGTFNLFNHPWVASLVFYKEACWASHEEQDTKQQSSMNSASPSSPRFPVWVPTLAFLKWLWLHICQPNKILPPQAVYGHDVSSQQ